ncbi:MAG TPA: biotin-dependent carboxyltransferase family protein [Dinghuibacter sp.]|uniref:5-oxoprolinase subunit C family protein n=1 Tax=Dinghuibacter sp. TaxID=2024697 RepID=UPI002D12D96E|nr:biotin-dependent carboxyltransferase family protein [Dinghuibacter sp.]HTJ12788.1 biotin-dependent carboxyltransferase family protein [Dinghuibacter sp.]
MGIQVIKQGIADSLQDLGRRGYQHLGINPGGVMDEVACRVANMLVGNEPAEAVLELHFPAGSFLFQEEALIALAGADFGATINRTPIPLHTPVVIGRNSVLEFKRPTRGAHCYLAVRDGFRAPRWLNSYSTNLRARVGGYNGRILEKQDEIPFYTAGISPSITGNRDMVVLPWQADVQALYDGGDRIRLVEGHEWDWLNEPSRQLLTCLPFTISAQSDRMGYRLKGPSLKAVSNRQMISTGVTRGTIQLLPSGDLIVLMADHQSTGGYPRLAHVAGVDVPRLAQYRFNEQVGFEIISVAQAEDLLVSRDQSLQQLQGACALRLNKYLQEYGIHRSEL